MNRPPSDERRSQGTPPTYELFAAWVTRTPGAVAVVHGASSLTYAELAARASRLAALLVAEGARPGDRVALALERSFDTIVAVLAILEAGCAYMPLETTYPRERLAFMLRDATPRLLITQTSLRERLPAPPDGCKAVLVDVDAERIAKSAPLPARVEVSPDDVVYVMYTSGSTGTPKGVEVVHRAIERLVIDPGYVRLGADTAILHAAPLAFDASTFEIWGALANGGRIVLYPDAVPTARGLRDAIGRHGVTTMWLTAALFNAVIDEDPTALAGLREVLTGGEALSVPHVRRALDSLPKTTIINGYGPTETTTFACCFPIPRTLDAAAKSVPIGRAIRETQTYLLDASLHPVKPGEIGELYIGGAGLARGYLARPDLTDERFVRSPIDGARLYRTGDLVVERDGLLDYVARADSQVKIRGYRIELGEIEAALAGCDGVKRAVVVAREDVPGMKRLVAYLVPEDGAKLSTPAIRAKLAVTLPDYMVPAAFVLLRAIPVTTNGKLDTRALPAPSSDRPELANEYVAPKGGDEVALAALWRDLLGISPVGATDNFFDLGGSSLLAVRMMARVRSELGIDAPVLRLFEHPTIRSFVTAVRSGGALESKLARFAARESRCGREAIAIVGMVGRYPGARDVDALWNVLRDGRETTSRFTDAELDPSIPASLKGDPTYVRARGILDDVDKFDAGFFGIPPKEAEIMDPQQRVLLELAWAALENAGHMPESFDGAIGVFAGKYNDSYWSENVVTRPDLVDALGTFQSMVANEKDYVATRIAHRLDLTGPAVSIHTACSTSLVTIASAVRSLQSGDCDLALAGGVSITVPVKSGYLYQEGAMLSDDGCTRTFDADARGTVFSDGAGLVVLRRLDDAVRDGDTIWAVIRGVAINNDGGGKASFTAPSIEGQATVVARAHADAGIDPRTIGYVEAHGTATPLGDPIEVEALTRAFRSRTSDVGFCGIGSIKSNFGHSVIAAGVAGVIKTALAFTHEQIPATLFYKAANPKIDFAASPFRVISELTPWPRSETPRRAGVSSFGVGGTNAHAVLEEAPRPVPSRPSRAKQLLLVSARSAGALDAAKRALADHLAKSGEPQSLADVAFTLHVGRRAFRHRSAFVCDTATGVVAQLRESAARPSTRATLTTPPSVVFLFPGQGAQYVGMGRALYEDEPVFREALDECAELLRPHLELDLRTVMHPTNGDAAASAAALRETRFTQPALFAIEYALAKLWESWGVKPSAMIGHSVGEFVCAVLAGVMTLEDALVLVAARGRLMQALPDGSMLSVREPAATVRERLKDTDLAIASDNGPSLCVVAGPTPQIDALTRRLEAEGVVCKPLHTSHAFHSPMMDPAIEPFAELTRKVTLSPPRVPFVSTVSGTWITVEQARDPMYWARHLRETVRFADGVRTLWAEKEVLLLEVGPRTTLATLARQQVSDRATQVAVSSLTDDPAAEWASLLNAAGQLWMNGVVLDGARIHGPRRRVPLPTYPFERQRFWIERNSAATSPVLAPLPVVQPTTTTHASPASASPPTEEIMESTQQLSASRTARLTGELRRLLEDTSGVEIGDGDDGTSFVELGLDSLLLTQVALRVSKSYGVKLTFRQLIEEFATLERLARELDVRLPAEAAPAPAAAPVVPTTSAAPTAPAATAPIAFAPLAASSATAGTLQYVIDQQLRIMAQQLAALGAAPQGMPVAAAPPATTAPAATVAAVAPRRPEPAAAAAADPLAEAHTKYDVKKAFGAIARIHTHKNDALTPKQKARLEAFTRRYNARTSGSKQHAQDNRAHLADPRVVTGFRPAMKELVYPLVVTRSGGPKLWDIDGNEYVDVLNGFGCNLFGWQPEFVNLAVEKQLRVGHEIGPTPPLAGETAKLFCELTGNDRAGFCNTGSEAVMGCMRIARTITGRSKIAIFTGSYHGIFDEVIVRGTKKLRAVPAAPGIMPSTAENVIVLDYGTPETLAILKEQASELAAILVEPVQSRRPDFQPREFLHELRKLTTESGSLLIFDEVITGFRTGIGGAQEYFGVKADLASYGKVVGGGYPIGVIAGKREYMDALDGGHWQFGDASIPTVGVTYFAGTFVRHPLALAAARAVLLHLKEQGPALQQRVTGNAARLASELNAHFASVGAPMVIKHFSSLWKPFWSEEQPFGDLFFYMLRDRGVHIYDGFPCFFTSSHGDAEVDFVIKAFKEATAEMQEAGFLPAPPPKENAASLDSSRPPVPGARLGRDPEGNPAWFVPNPTSPGKFVKVTSPS